MERIVLLGEGGGTIDFRTRSSSGGLGEGFDLLVIDDVCRTVSTSEIPIGVVTGIIGVPVFLYFIYRKKVNW